MALSLCHAFDCLDMRRWHVIAARIYAQFSRFDHAFVKQQPQQIVVIACQFVGILGHIQTLCVLVFTAPHAQLAQTCCHVLPELSVKVPPQLYHAP